MRRNLIRLGRSILSFLLVFALCACTAGGSGGTQTSEASAPFTVKILSVGKADAILLLTENHTVVVDTGNKGDGKAILSALSEAGREAIDTLIITHFDKDHAGGAVRLLNDISIGEVIVPDYAGAGTAYERFQTAMEENEMSASTLIGERTLIFDDVAFTLYPALSDTYEEEDNDFSIVLSVVHGENSFLFAGDAEEERLGELAAQMDLKHDFLKVPHHGGYEDASASFFSAVSPAFAVITDSEEEPADERVTESLKSMGTAVYSTRAGEVCAVSDGKEITVTQ